MRRAIRVLHVTHSVYCRDVRIRRYAEYLAHEGHSVHVVCLRSEDSEPQTKYPLIKVFPIPMARHRMEGIWHLFNWAISSLLMFFYISFLGLKYRYDLIHIHNMPDFLVFTAIVPRIRGCSLLFNLHDPSPEVARSKLEIPPEHILIRILIFIERISIAFSDHVIAASPAFREILINRGVPEEKISVVMNAADPRFFNVAQEPRKYKFKNGNFNLLYVGTVARRYGLETCIRALPILRKQIPRIKLKIFPKIRDEGRELENCITLAKSLDVNDLLDLNDPAPLELMPQIMKEADIGVYPALRDCHMDIALSLKIPEMINMGLPIVSSRLSVLEELYGDNAIAFVPPGDVEAFAQKIIELYDNPNLMERLSQNALKKALVLTWESQYKTYRQVIESMLNLESVRAD